MRFDLLDLPKEEALRETAKKYPALDPVAFNSHLMMLKLSTLIQNAMDIHFARYDLTACRFYVLMVLYKKVIKEEAGPGLSASCIAERLGVTRGNMTGIIDGLEKSGLIKRQDDPKDRRSWVISPTPKGIKLIEKILPDHFARITKAMKRLSEKEHKQFQAMLERFADGMQELTRS